MQYANQDMQIHIKYTQHECSEDTKFKHQGGKIITATVISVPHEKEIVLIQFRRHFNTVQVFSYRSDPHQGHHEGCEDQMSAYM